MVWTLTTVAQVIRPAIRTDVQQFRWFGGESLRDQQHLVLGNQLVVLHLPLQLQPTCVVSYDRMAFNGSEYDDGLRITFDTNLKGRTHALSLETIGHAESQFFIPPDWCIMEVKVNYRVPYWVTEMIGKYRFTLRRVSKYCAALEQSKSLMETQRITY